MKKIKIIIENFEKISESQQNNLIGGFSKSYNKGKDDFIVVATDNCDGGNCVSGCGGPVNFSCNTVAGCS